MKNYKRSNSFVSAPLMDAVFELQDKLQATTNVFIDNAKHPDFPVSLRIGAGFAAGISLCMSIVGKATQIGLFVVEGVASAVDYLLSDKKKAEHTGEVPPCDAMTICNSNSQIFRRIGVPEQEESVAAASAENLQVASEERVEQNDMHLTQEQEERFSCRLV